MVDAVCACFAAAIFGGAFGFAWGCRVTAKHFAARLSAELLKAPDRPYPLDRQCPKCHRTPETLGAQCSAGGECLDHMDQQEGLDQHG